MLVCQSQVRQKKTPLCRLLTYYPPRYSTTTGVARDFTDQPPEAMLGS